MDNQQLEKLAELLSEMMAKAFDKATAYTNVIIIAGYAGAFTIWANTKTQLTPYTNVVVATALGLSILMFVGWEIYSMIIRSAQFLRRSQIINSTASDQLLKKLADMRSQEVKFVARQMPIWIIVLCITVGFALIAIGTLSYNYFVILLTSS